MPSGQDTFAASRAMKILRFDRLPTTYWLFKICTEVGREVFQNPAAGARPHGRHAICPADSLRSDGRRAEDKEMFREGPGSTRFVAGIGVSR